MAADLGYNIHQHPLSGAVISGRKSLPKTITSDERIEIAVRSLRHGSKYFDVGEDLCTAGMAVSDLVRKDCTWQPLYEEISAINECIHECINTYPPRSDFKEIFDALRNAGLELERMTSALPGVRKAIKKMSGTSERMKEVYTDSVLKIEPTWKKIHDRVAFSEGSKGNVEQSCNVGALLRGDNVYVHRFLDKIEDVVVPEINTLRFFETLENLIRNAFRHGQAKNVRVSVTKEGDKCRILVANDGVEIAPRLLEEGSTPGRLRLFELNETTKKNGIEGGLGTAIAWYFAMDHGGDIEVESTKGKGTVFTIILPIAAGEFEA